MTAAAHSQSSAKPTSTLAVIDRCHVYSASARPLQCRRADFMQWLPRCDSMSRARPVVNCKASAADLLRPCRRLALTHYTTLHKQLLDTPRRVQTTSFLINK